MEFRAINKIAVDEEEEEEEYCEEEVPVLSAKNFETYLRTAEAALSKAIEEVQAGSNVNDELDALLVQVQALNTEFTNRSHTLPKFHENFHHKAIKSLEADVRQCREKLAPRKKFQFKRKPVSASSESKTLVAEMKAGPSVSFPATTALHSSAGKIFEDLRNEGLLSSDGSFTGQDVSFRGLEGCRFVLLDQVGAVHCHGLIGCEIIIGVVSSSILLYDCQKCSVTVAAKQVRLHNSQEMLLHVHALSGPVIEHSKQIWFSPFDLSYPAHATHWSAAGFPLERSSAWAEVQDFNWHKRQASPNWSIVSEALRRAPETLAHTIKCASDAPLPPPLEDLRQCQCSQPGKEVMAANV